MMFKKISFGLLLVLPFAALADDYHTTSYYYSSDTSILRLERDYSGSIDAAFDLASRYVTVRISPSDFSFRLQSPGLISVSNKTTGATYTQQDNPVIFRQMNQLEAIRLFSVRNSLTLEQMLMNFTTYYNGSFYFFTRFNIAQYVQAFFSSLDYSQMQQVLQILADLNTIKTDVSALVPLVESNRNINAGIALDFRNATTNAQYQRSEIINDLTTIINNRLLNNTVDYDIPQIRDDIRALVSVNPSAPYSDNNALALEYFDLLGFDYSQDQAALVQAMINAGLATDNNDALGKLSSTTWRRNTLGPYVQVQRKKRDLIAQARQAGITHNFDGRSLEALANPELETLLQYSFNTPASSNATLNAHSLEALKQIDSEVTDAAGKLHDIDNKLEGPLNVNVLNWPDDWLANSVSNALDGVFSGLLDGITNFNPHYTFDDDTFFARNLYSWRGFGQSALDQTEQNPVERDSAIGVTSFEFNPTGDFFQDVPNLLAMQSMQGADLANIFATVAIHVQSNAQEMANTDALVDQYQEDLATAAAEALDDFQSMMHYSNLLSNVQFTDTQDLLELPDGFRVFSGDWQVPEYVNIELPTWDFQQPGTDGNNPPTRHQVNPGHTITIDTTQYRSFFQNVRYASLVLYWGLLVCFVLVLFRIFRAFVAIIPKTLTGNADSSYTA